MSEQMQASWLRRNRGLLITASTGVLSIVVATLCLNIFGTHTPLRNNKPTAASYLTTAPKKQKAKYEYSFVRNTRHDGSDPISCLSGPWNDCVGKIRGK
jgi:hypothetical protein